MSTFLCSSNHVITLDKNSEFHTTLIGNNGFENDKLNKAKKKDFTDNKLEGERGHRVKV